MTELSLKFAMECLSNLSISQIEITDHYLKRSRERDISDKSVIDCLIKKEPLGMLKENDDKFRIYYEHPDTPNENDLIIIVGMNYSTQHITIITTYNQNINMRVRINGQR